MTTFKKRQIPIDTQLLYTDERALSIITRELTNAFLKGTFFTAGILYQGRHVQTNYIWVVDYIYIYIFIKPKFYYLIENKYITFETKENIMIIQ